MVKEDDRRWIENAYDYEDVEMKVIEEEGEEEYFSFDEEEEMKEIFII